MGNVNTELPTGYIHEHDDTFYHLSKGDSIATAMLDERNEAILLVDEILERLTKLNNLMEDYCPIRGKAYKPLAGDLLDIVSSYSENFSSHRENIRKKIDGRYWLKIIHASRITSLVNAAKKKEMEKSSSESAPDFTFDAVFGTINMHYENRLKTFVEAGVELFESLSHEFKSNDRICLRKKIIFKNALSGSNWNSYGSAKDRIYDIERIFMILEGKDPGGLIFTETVSHHLIEAAQAGKSIYHHEYFDAKLYNNGNIHLTFNRQDLVNKFNKLLANYHSNKLGTRASKY